MRIIKFRCFDTDKKIMIQDVSHIQRDGLIVMQYTEIKDKNGKEIYEGDIVKECAWNDWEKNSKRIWTKGREILWLEYSLSFGYKDSCFGLYSTAGYEIIGNIYENPELLNETKTENMGGG